MKRKILAVLLVCIFALALFGCDPDTGQKNSPIKNAKVNGSNLVWDCDEAGVTFEFKVYRSGGTSEQKSIKISETTSKSVDLNAWAESKELLGAAKYVFKIAVKESDNYVDADGTYTVPMPEVTAATINADEHKLSWTCRDNNYDYTIKAYIGSDVKKTVTDAKGLSLELVELELEPGTYTFTVVRTGSNATPINAAGNYIVASDVTELSLNGNTVEWEAAAGASYRIYLLLENPANGNLQNMKTITVPTASAGLYTLTATDLSGLFNGSYTVGVGIYLQQPASTAPKAPQKLVINDKPFPEISGVNYNSTNREVSWTSSIPNVKFSLRILKGTTLFKETAASTATTIKLDEQLVGVGTYTFELTIENTFKTYKTEFASIVHSVADAKVTLIELVYNTGSVISWNCATSGALFEIRIENS